MSDKKSTKKKLVFVPPKQPDAAPPHALEAERGALGCIFLAANDVKSITECDAMLMQLRPKHFYDVRNRTVFEELTKMRIANHSVEMNCVIHWLKKEKKLDTDCGGLLYISALTEATPSPFAFPEYLRILQDYSHRRFLLQKGEEFKALAAAETISIEDTKERLAELFDAATKATNTALIEVITPKEARGYKADATDFLIGQGLISQETFVTIGGEPGCGKSRLATTAAVAGARGFGTWQGYPVRCKFNTLILQTENKGNRLKEEFDAVPAEYDECIRVSKNLPHGLAFGNPDFRRELQRLHEKWPFQMLVIDPWNDACADEGQSDFKETLLNIQSCFRGRKMPAVVIVAHLRKPRTDSSGRRKSGRELLHELSGSLALGSTSRTVFAVQPASYAMDDDRIVFEVAKANDADPKWLAEHGTRSAWHRKNGAFESCKAFDWENWMNPATNNQERQAITLEMLKEAFGNRKGMKRSELVKTISTNHDVGESTVWRAINKEGYLHKYLTEATAGIVGLK